MGFILSMGTRIRIDSVMYPRSSSRGRNTSASVTVTVTAITVTPTSRFPDGQMLFCCHHTSVELQWHCEHAFKNTHHMMHLSHIRSWSMCTGVWDREELYTHVACEQFYLFKLQLLAKLPGILSVVLAAVTSNTPTSTAVTCWPAGGDELEM